MRKAESVRREREAPIPAGALTGKILKSLRYDVFNLGGKVDFETSAPTLEFEDGAVACFALGPHDDEIVVMANAQEPSSYSLEDWLDLRRDIGVIEHYEPHQSVLVTYLRSVSAEGPTYAFEEEAIIEASIRFGRVILTVALDGADLRTTFSLARP